MKELARLTLSGVEVTVGTWGEDVCLNVEGLGEDVHMTDYEAELLAKALLNSTREVSDDSKTN